jgi:hypothetical protein
MMKVSGKNEAFQNVRLLAKFQIYHIAQNCCDLKMLSLIGAVFGFEHITKI